MTFEVIAGSGHCGTMWLARVLDSVPGQTWHHELRGTVTGRPWWVDDRFPPDVPVFNAYWRRVKAAAAAGQFGDANSWPPESLPDVNQVLPIDRVIYLTRDKRAQHYSLMMNSPVWNGMVKSQAAKARLKLYTEITGRPRDTWLLVEANDFMPVWLREHGLQVDVYSLEELTTDLDALRELAPLPDEELRAWQKKKINSKMHQAPENKMLAAVENKA